MKFPFVCPFAAAAFVWGAVPSAATGISYTVAGATYEENFDSLPSDVATAANIQNNGYPNGWRDDSSVVAGDHVGVPGWYLYHPNAGPLFNPLPEGGTNGHQRIRFGAGANTGGFWAFWNSSSPTDIALGGVGSTVVADNDVPIFRALQLINNTGVTLTSFTVAFDGEQWRDGQSPAPETQTCAYSLAATAADWYSTAPFTAVPALDFTSPVFTGTTNAGDPVDGNTAGRRQDISATVTNITWAPGTELWLRWSDPQLAGNADDGLAIDNVRFTAAASPGGDIPDANLTFGHSGGGALQLEWQGAGPAVSYQVQHSADLQAWTNATDPAPEIAGPMTWVIPVEQLTGGRRYFRLRRVTTAG